MYVDFCDYRDEVKADPHLIMLLRIYTVDIDTRELVVIGSIFYELFDRNQVTISL